MKQLIGVHFYFTDNILLLLKDKAMALDPKAIGLCTEDSLKAAGENKTNTGINPCPPDQLVLAFSIKHFGTCRLYLARSIRAITSL